MRSQYRHVAHSLLNAKETTAKRHPDSHLHEIFRGLVNTNESSQRARSIREAASLPLSTFMFLKDECSPTIVM